MALDSFFERAETLVDRNQFYDRGPRVNKILKGRAHLAESVENLIHCSERNLTCDDGRAKNDIGKDVVGLKIYNAANVEIHEVEIEPKIVAPDRRKKLVEGRRSSPIRIILGARAARSFSARLDIPQ
jgi:hypothetical protein